MCAKLCIRKNVSYVIYPSGVNKLISIIATPQVNLSQKLMKPYTTAELSTLFPIKSAVIDNPVTRNSSVIITV